MRRFGQIAWRVVGATNRAKKARAEGNTDGVNETPGPQVNGRNVREEAITGNVLTVPVSQRHPGVTVKVCAPAPDGHLGRGRDEGASTHDRGANVRRGNG